MRIKFIIILLLITIPAFSGKRYFIADAATENWNDTGVWSLTDGGSTGADVPVSTDSVYFTALSLSSSCVLTVNATANCDNLDFTGLDAALTLSSSANSINIYGSLICPASNLTWTFTSTAYVYFKSTRSVTITMGSTTGRTMNRIYFDGSGGTWTLQDEMSVSGSVFLVNGELNTNDKSVTATYFYTNSGTKTLTLGNSSLFFNRFQNDNPTGLTLYEGTSTINISGGRFYGGGETYYNVSCNVSGSLTIQGASSFNNLTINVYDCSLNANQTITGVLTLTRLSATQYRLLIYSDVLGTPRTLTVNGSTNITNTDFRDITFAGSAIPNFSTGTGGDVETGDCGGNSGATYRTGVKRYYHVGTGNYHDAKWYTATNGGGSAAGMPLAQDTAIWDASSFDGTATLTIANSRVGHIDFSGVDDSVTVTLSNVIECYGDWLGSTNNTYSGNYTRTMMGRGSYNMNFAGKTIYDLTENAYGGTYTVTGNVIYRLFTLTQGTINLGSYTLESNANTAVTPWTYTAGTINAGSSTLKFNPASGSSNLTFAGGGKTYNHIWISGASTGQFILTGSNNFNEFKIDAGRTVKFTAGTSTQINDVVAVGTSGSHITWGSVTNANHTITTGGTTYGDWDMDYVDLTYSTANNNNLYTVYNKPKANINKIVGVDFSTVHRMTGLTLIPFHAGSHSTKDANSTNWILAD